MTSFCCIGLRTYSGRLIIGINCHRVTETTASVTLLELNNGRAETPHDHTDCLPLIARLTFNLFGVRVVWPRSAMERYEVAQILIFLMNYQTAMQLGSK
jgi:hypothetical protein